MARLFGYMNFLRRSLRRPARLALLFLCVVLGVGTKGIAASLPSAPTSSLPAGSRFAIADFDGDSRPDVASVEIGQIGVSQARYWIGFHMSAGGQQRIGLTGPLGGLEIASRDVNGDKSPDLVVTAAWFKSPIAVLVNDGHGKFTLTDPAEFSSINLSPQETWTPPNLDLKDAPTAMLARASGDCIFWKRLQQGSPQPGKALFTASHHELFAFAVSAQGRAPPSFVVHV